MFVWAILTIFFFPVAKLKLKLKKKTAEDVVAGLSSGDDAEDDVIEEQDSDQVIYHWRGWNGG